MNVHVPFISPEAPVQAGRILRIETPLGSDVVLPERFELTEGIGGFEAGGLVRPGEAGLFSGWIAVRSLRHDIAASEIVGRMVDVSVELSAGDGSGAPGLRRTWHCLVSELLVGPPVTRGLRSYRLTLRPAHWLLTRKKDCRIWQNVSSVDVARTLLSEHGLSAPVTDGVVGAPPPQSYSVQFNESDWAYLMRRLEQDGLFAWTRHEAPASGGMGSVAGSCELHIASDVSGYTTSPFDGGRVRYAAGSTDQNHITRFDTSFAFVPGARSGADWNFLTPGTVPQNQTPSLVDLPGGALGSNAQYESFEYPSVGGYGTGEGADGASEGIADAEVERLERLRAQAHEADHARVVGEGTVRTLAPGQLFTPFDVPAESGLAALIGRAAGGDVRGAAEAGAGMAVAAVGSAAGLIGSAADGAAEFAEHVVVSVTHRAIDQSYESQGGAPEYGCEFEALPASTPATPHRSTPRPRIDGQQIALVAGPDGEEIHTDRFGRIKLWFPWDRRASKDGSDTCWVRVAQSWAGGGWGAQTIPRIGMEALVSYLDGDPDRPVVTGLVPNPQQKVPYELPANKTKSVFRTDSYKQAGFNELTFEDAGGREKVFLHAQRDLTLKVRNHSTERIDRNQVTSIGGAQVNEVVLSSTHNVGQNLSINVGAGAQGLVVRGALAAETYGIAASGYFLDDLTDLTSGGGNYSVSATGSISLDAGGPIQTETEMDHVSDVGGSFRMTVGESSFVSAAQNSTEIVGRTKTIDCHDTIHLRCGKSEIIMKANGEVTMRGTKLLIEEEDQMKVTAGRIELN